MLCHRRIPNDYPNTICYPDVMQLSDLRNSQALEYLFLQGKNNVCCFLFLGLSKVKNKESFS